jgi:hypothetical protein
MSILLSIPLDKLTPCQSGPALTEAHPKQVLLGKTKCRIARQVKPENMQIRQGIVIDRVFQPATFELPTYKKVLPTPGPFRKAKNSSRATCMNSSQTPLFLMKWINGMGL